MRLLYYIYFYSALARNFSHFILISTYYYPLLIPIPLQYIYTLIPVTSSALEGTSVVMIAWQNASIVFSHDHRRGLAA